ncbi:MAG: Ig-like domain-containing protein [Leptospiraceae bacterium]|nr:Ig-like domain-containing protein [Leptospiraceae bacterium]
MKLFLTSIILSFFFNCGTALGLSEQDETKSKNNSLLLFGLGTRNNAVIPPPTPIKIESHIPTQGATGVSTNPVIFIQFSKAFQEETLTTTSIEIMNSTIPVNFSIQTANQTSIFLILQKNLDISKTYTVNLGTTIKDKDGLSLASKYSYSFTTSSSDPDSGSVTTLSGNGTIGDLNGSGTDSSFNSPEHLTMNSAESELYITDTGNHQIRTVAVSTGTTSIFAGLSSGYVAATGTAARFNFPRGIGRITGDLFFISDSGNHGIRRMTNAAVVTNSFGTNVNTSGFIIINNATGNRYRNPEGFVMDNFSGNQYVVDTGNHCIRRSTNVGTGIANTTANACFAGSNPVAGNGVSGFLNGIGNAARLNSPRGIAVDSLGNLFIPDSGNHSIRMITPAGIVTTIAGNGSSGYVNGTGPEARFNNPTDIAVLGDKILFVTDTGNCVVRKLILDDNKVYAKVSTYAGATPEVSSRCGNKNSSRLESRFSNLVGLWLASNGKLYLTDTGNHSIKVITE